MVCVLTTAPSEGVTAPGQVVHPGRATSPLHSYHMVVPHNRATRVLLYRLSKDGYLTPAESLLRSTCRSRELLSARRVFRVFLPPPTHEELGAAMLCFEGLLYYIYRFQADSPGQTDGREVTPPSP